MPAEGDQGQTAEHRQYSLVREHPPVYVMHNQAICPANCSYRSVFMSLDSWVGHRVCSVTQAGGDRTCTCFNHKPHADLKMLDMFPIEASYRAPVSRIYIYPATSFRAEVLPGNVNCDKYCDKCIVVLQSLMCNLAFWKQGRLSIMHA